MAESYLEQVARERAYMDEVRTLLDRRDSNGEWTVEMASDYRALLVRHGILQSKPVPKKS